MTKVFVYGSLLSGMGNHRLLSTSKLLGCTRTEGFEMLDLGWFPGVIKGPGSVSGEVYEVDDETFQRLDRLEGYNMDSPDKGLYNRMEIDTEFGKAHIYVFNHGWGDRKKVKNGDWKSYFKR